MTELPDRIFHQIQQLSAVGDSFAETQEYEQALEQYWLAWELLPEPRPNWEAATWLLTAMGDANFLNGDFEVLGGKNPKMASSQCQTRALCEVIKFLST